MNIENSNVGVDETNTKVYEVSALFVPELEGSELSQTVDSLKKKITDLGSNIISEGAPVHIKLAYTVEKHINNKIRRADFAHFYWVKFETSPANIKSIETFLKLDLVEKVLRYLLVKTIAANTVLTEIDEIKANDVKNDNLIDEVLNSDLKAEAATEKVDEANTITDLGGDTPLKKDEEENTENK